VVAGPAEDVIATEVHSRFFPEPSSIGTLQNVPPAGLRLLSVSAAHSGNYSVHVNVNVPGTGMVTYVQSLHLQVPGKLAIPLSLRKPFCYGLYKNRQL
jgi:hypothetical protein